MGTRPPSTGREVDRVDLGTYGSMWIFYLRYKIFNDLRIRSERTPEKHGAFPALRPNRRADGDFGPEVIFAESGNMSFQGNFRLLAAGIAVIVAQTTRSVIATICFGMLSLWMLEWVY